MNTQSTRPPEFDLDPRTRARQRDELIAIVENESARPVSLPRRVAVPLLAAAAVVAVVTGLAFAVPALRGDKAQAPAAGQGATVATPALELLTSSERAAYGAKCGFGKATVTPKGTVVDGFRWVNPPAESRATTWVVVKQQNLVRACGFNAKGQQSEFGFASKGEAQRDVIDKKGAGSGTYTKGVARVTIAIGSGPATEAVLRDGFFFAPMKYVDTYDPKTPDAPPAYTVRAYDAAGKQVYASPATQQEMTAQLDGCYTDPDGKRVVFSGGGRSDPPINECTRGIAWTW